jgi:hypothetical protein
VSDARLRNLERELTLDPARVDLVLEHARLLERAGRADEALASLDLAWRLGRQDLEAELGALLAARSVTHGTLTYRYIPAGPFLMGSERGDSDEAPAHIVRLSAFYMAERLLRWSDFDGWDASLPLEDSGFTPEEVRSMPYWRDQLVSGLSFHRVQLVLAGLGTSAGGRPGLRPPTEAQWERVRRARVLTPGRNVYGVDVGVGVTGDGSPNAEWTSDFYDSTSYDRAARLDPTGPTLGEDIAVRGAFDGPAFVKRATYRESVDRDGNFEAFERTTKFLGLFEGRGAGRRLPPVMGLHLRPCFPAAPA